MEITEERWLISRDDAILAGFKKRGKERNVISGIPLARRGARKEGFLFRGEFLWRCPAIESARERERERERL